MANASIAPTKTSDIAGAGSDKVESHIFISGGDVAYCGIVRMDRRPYHTGDLVCATCWWHHSRSGKRLRVRRVAA